MVCPPLHLSARLKEAFLSVRAMKNARNVRKQLEQEVRKAGLNPTSAASDVDCIARAFTAGNKDIRILDMTGRAIHDDSPFCLSLLFPLLDR